MARPMNGRSTGCGAPWGIQRSAQEQVAVAVDVHQEVADRDHDGSELGLADPQLRGIGVVRGGWRALARVEWLGAVAGSGEGECAEGDQGVARSHCRFLARWTDPTSRGHVTVRLLQATFPFCPKHLEEARDRVGGPGARQGFLRSVFARGREHLQDLRVHLPWDKHPIGCHASPVCRTVTRYCCPMHYLSKSRFVAGWQCPKLLWWKVHEPDAVELQPDRVLQDRFDQGEQVGQLARLQFPGGMLIDLPHTAVQERLAATQAALDAGAPAIFEASFLAGDVFVAVDVLLPHRRWLHADRGQVILVDQGRAHPRRCHPDLGAPSVGPERSRPWRSCTSTRSTVIRDVGPLFVREDVTELVEAFLPGARPGRGAAADDRRPAA